VEVPLTIIYLSTLYYQALLTSMLRLGNRPVVARILVSDAFHQKGVLLSRL
jgi:hypothetical protein